ncbi:hypothetical protein VOLCADRAFT_69452 [Volvox carteri f. nagariensis]|uniref:Uncharacterized protein n=1 Tax=Volvox carteri f. nagariensis TaxID=3068 RepID=D8UIF9_VOLCA|nr:uncharacterized protein VOLCADRAFT_69452 [Volvox carteri f. nagariensis]EFJ40504.1 hypothetical protein VOLCADRAFT_69452 [Volvox carteri f. nagariensis]|eukprot:XP_002958428.1 hypothetical protein VOLCADRAFT_69452 [Volvox carteri f. nagariensis]
MSFILRPRAVVGRGRVCAGLLGFLCLSESSPQEPDQAGDVTPGKEYSGRCQGELNPSYIPPPSSERPRAPPGISHRIMVVLDLVGL